MSNQRVLEDETSESPQALPARRQLKDSILFQIIVAIFNAILQIIIGLAVFFTVLHDLIVFFRPIDDLNYQRGIRHTPGLDWLIVELFIFGFIVFFNLVIFWRRPADVRQQHIRIIRETISTIGAAALSGAIPVMGLMLSDNIEPFAAFRTLVFIVVPVVFIITWNLIFTVFSRYWERVTTFLR